MRSANPTLSDTTFREVRRTANSRPMTLDGVISCSAWLLALVLGGAAGIWYYQPPAGLVISAAPVAAFVVAIVIILRKQAAPFLAPVYALAEGVALGGITLGAEQVYPGIAVQALGLTLGIFTALLVAYRSRLIQPSENFKLMVFSGTVGIGLYYLASFVGGMFGFQMPLIHESGLLGIGFSLLVVALASLNLVLDFDFIEQGVQARAPRYMEWYAAFGLVVTLVWLYLEVLHLLAKLRQRD
ncbi:MAG: Bax inhibitor-1/YccA family protein [Candidatus Sericytochromatia bacterium]|nr:Bax inhibitor-1/YccA family protein [Candidatus Sericytochromatia bacterium]